ncbi:RagB/SusD family nutrient uptake outer membrane protein [Niastella caeni]|nr:RagB/SusD family nutrient uptake outer membrane protein [Niastella caeni]
MKKIVLLIYSALGLLACKKDKLNTKPDSTQIIPETIAYYQMLLDNQNYFNYTTFLAETGSDNYYATENAWTNFNAVCKYSYIWAQDPFEGGTVNDWNLSYTTIYYANTVLEGINRLGAEKGSPAGLRATGEAYFHRAHAFFQLAQLFCKVYDPATAKTDLGIPLRKRSDVTLGIARSTVQETYDQIIADLLEAEKLLPPLPDYKTRPGKLAVAALLSRVYLSMSDYDRSFQYADKALSQYNVLMNYHTIKNTGVPFKQFNDEVIWHTVMGGSMIFNADNNCSVDTALYESFDSNDMRKQLFFGIGNRPYFKGTYAGLTTSFKFCGLAVDELYLTRAECYAHKDMLREAMNDLNTLMTKRWNNNNSFKPFQATTKKDALQQILRERRKELLFRGLRWMDLRRLNLAGADINLKRIIGNDTFHLSANSLRYIYPIPDQELTFNEMPQNER